MKKAITFRAVLPALAATLENEILNGDNLLSKSLLPNQLHTFGFDRSKSGNLVESFAGGYTFLIRTDSKIIPAGALNQMVNDEVALIEASNGHKVKKQEKAKIRECLILDLMPNAMVDTKFVRSYYNTKDNLLIVDGSANQADVVMHLLRHAMGSIKTTTITVNHRKGLTARFNESFNNDADMNSNIGNFVTGDSLLLIDPVDKATAKFTGDMVESHELLIDKLLKNGYQVEKINLTFSDCDFVLDKNFHFSAVKFPQFSEDHDVADFPCIEDAEEHERSVKVALFSAALNSMCDLFDYEEPEMELIVEPDMLMQPDNTPVGAYVKGHVDVDIFFDALTKDFGQYDFKREDIKQTHMITAPDGYHTGSAIETEQPVTIVLINKAGIYA